MIIRDEISFIAEKEYASLEKFLIEKGMSKKLIVQLKFINCLLINNIPMRTIDPVHKKDVIRVLLKQESKLTCQPQKGEFQIIYEDLDILVVDKKAGIATHPAKGTSKDTLANYVVNYFCERGIDMPFRPISRLDRDTSGIIVIAKNKYVDSVLSQNKNKKFEKVYLAKVSGKVSKNGEIIIPIDRKSPDSILRVCRADGKFAHTKYKVIHASEKESLLEVIIKTGRTHQIRVHMKEIGHPIIGDQLYGYDCADRLYLHSYKATISHPITEEIIEFIAPIHWGN